MSRNTKIILVLVSTSLLACVLLCATMFILLPRLASDAITAGKADPKKVSSEIADYALPPGYEEEMAMDAFFYQTVTIAPASGQGVIIMLMQTTATNANQQQLNQQMQQVFQKQLEAASGVWKYAGERTVTIKGKPTTLAISEIRFDNAVMRQAQGAFTGKRGLVMVMVQGSGEEWNWDMLDAFFQSIR